ncbi:interleukin-17 receptor C-like [Tautogolabrus adspersus]
MITPGWSIWCLLLTLHMSASNLDASGYNSHEVICSQGLSNCTMKDEMSLSMEENTSVNVQNLTPNFKLCCKDGASCWLCLVINMEINIRAEKDMEDEGHSGRDEEEYNEEMSNSKASVSVCFNTAHTFPSCKRVEFTVNHADLTQQHRAKFAPRSCLSVYKSVECPDSSVLLTKRRIYEQNGRCLIWKRPSIPLYSVTTCMCFQVWDEDDQRSWRSLSCPFINTNLFHRNIWENISVTVGQGQMSNSRSMLSWNVSAPCRLEGEVWPCQRDLRCREVQGFRQQLAIGAWRQNKGLWVKTGVFEDINLQLSPCVMVKVRGMGLDLGPFCFENTDRWRWSLLVVGAMLIVCLTMIMLFLLHDFIKKWVWSCHYGGFVKVGRMCHVVLLSPPDVDAGVSESVCELGSLLSNRGLHVSVDQWSRKEQCALGPLPWLHSQLLELKSQGGRVVLVLTHNALERAEEWTRLHKEDIKIKVDNKDFPQMLSPYSDVFTASLCIIQADKQQGRAGERFLLVKFDSHPSSDRRLPELFQGLPLFHLPSKIKALLSELTVGGFRKGSS